MSPSTTPRGGPNASRAWCSRRPVSDWPATRRRSGSASTDPRPTQRPSIAQVLVSLVVPGLLVWRSQRVQVLRRRGRIIHPFPQQRAAVDDVDGELAMLVLIGEIPPQRIVRVQTTDR